MSLLIKRRLVREIWKDFLLDEKLYSISSNGRVYGYLKEDYIVSRLDKDGYPAVTLGKNKSRKIIRIHRLVATHFVKNNNPDKLNEVNHKDFNRANNHYSNLEWCTHSENIKYSSDAGRLFSK